MKRSNRLILLIGVFLAIVAFVGIVIIFQGNRTQVGADTPATPTELPTVFATRQIQLGTPITRDMLRVESQPLTGRASNAFGDPSIVVGRVVRTTVAEGKQLTEDDFGTSGAPLAIDTPPLQRAMAVQVDQVSGVGTLIRTGDWVDMVVGFNMNVISVDPDTGQVVEGAPEIDQSSTKVLLQGMQVLGTLLPPAPAPVEGAEAAEGEEPATETGTALNGQQEIVIVSVTAQQAEVIKLGQLNGSITLVLRSPADFRDPTTQEPIVPAVSETTGITLKVLVEEYGLLVPEVVETVLPFDAATPPAPAPEAP